LVLWPLFLIRAYHLKDPEKWIQSAILLFAGLVQLVLILSSDNGLRQGSFDGMTFLAIFIVKVCLVPVLGIELTASLVPFIQSLTTVSWSSSLLIITATGLVVWQIYQFIKPQLTADARYLLAASLLLFFFSVYGALGDNSQLINASGSGRYFIAANSLFYLSILALIVPVKKWGQQILPALVIALVIAMVIGTGMLSFWSDKHTLNMKENSWKQQILHNQDDLRKIMIQPAGWFVNLNQQDHQMMLRCQQNQFLSDELLCLIFKGDEFKINVLLIKNRQNNKKYELLNYKILENRNPAALPREVIYRNVFYKQTYDDQSDNNLVFKQDIKLKILQDGEFLSAVQIDPESL